MRLRFWQTTLPDHGSCRIIVRMFRALTTSPEDEFITIAPFFPRIPGVCGSQRRKKLVVVPPHTSDFQIDFDALEKAISAHTKGVIINSPNNPSGAVYSKRDDSETCRTSDKRNPKKTAHRSLSLRMNRTARSHTMAWKYRM